MSSAITDLSFLRENTFGSADTMRVFIDLYVKTSLQMVGEMQAALLQSDLIILKRTAHKLKSNMHTMGVKSAIHELDMLENFEGDLTNNSVVAEQIDKIQRLVDKSVVELNQVLVDLD